MNVIQPKKRKNLNNELKFRTTRVEVFLWLGKDPKPVKGYAYVSDIKKKGVVAYMARKLPVADFVLVGFYNETAAPFRAKIISNRSQAENHVLQNSEFNWKCGFSFEFSSEGEAKRYGEFWQELRGRTAMLARDVKQPDYKLVEGKADDVNFDDSLDDLDIGVLPGDDSGKKGAA